MLTGLEEKLKGIKQKGDELSQKKEMSGEWDSLVKSLIFTSIMLAHPVPHLRYICKK